MKHPSIRELYDYWDKQRGMRAAPDRADIEPGAIRRLLADTFIVAFDEPAGHPFRLAGTRVCAAFGGELKGIAFLDMWGPESQPLVRDLVTVVAQECVGVVASARAETSEGSHLEFEMVMLPLRHRGHTDARILGALAPTEAPYWFGVSALGPLALGTIRFLGIDHRAPIQPASHVPTSQPTGRIQHGFVVYNGGRP